MSEVKSPEEWGNEYEKIRNSYISYSLNLKDILEILLVKNSIDFDKVECRVKKVDSFINKIRRDPIKYTNPLVDITDLVGLRIIAYYVETLNDIGTIIETEFKVDISNSYKKSDILEPDRFEYLSDHYIVELSESRSVLTEWKDFSNIKFEIQVRTVLQHAWASISHKLQYKSESEVPSNLRRQLNSLSALLEVADREFTDLRKKTIELEENYVKVLKTGVLDIDINANSLDVYVKSKRYEETWLPLVLNIGYETIEEVTSVNQESKKVLLKILNMLEISTIEELDTILENVSKWSRRIFEHVYNIVMEENCSIYAVLYDLILLLIMYRFKTTINIELINQTNFNIGIVRAIKEYNAIE